MTRSTGLGAALCALSVTVAVSTLYPTPGAAADWSMFGQNLQNTAASAGGGPLKDVSQLKVKWTFTTGGDVSARAAVVDGVVYFPDWGGNSTRSTLATAS